ncbi:Acid shock protein [Xenorhabdus hominickii]|nr:Acid shock protein [Xenorhabdus hominickii]PHM57317.1 Acid shock protein [Xenorhabdus hominickii]
MMKSLKLSVAALLVLFSSTALAAPAVSTETASKTATAVEHNVQKVKNKAGSLEKKVTKGAKKQKSSGKKAIKKKGANTAQCKDGTYSKSKSHKGACSRHGGVAKWL